MSSQIAIQGLSAILRCSRESALSVPVLPGAIDGLDTLFHAMAPGSSHVFTPLASHGRAMLITAGNGRIVASHRSLPINEIALFAPVHGEPLTAHAGDVQLEILELRVRLNGDDPAEFAANCHHYPWFAPYSECPTYRERIKSDKTVSRTLMPEHTFPRLCVGSVQTTGDDSVAAHEHPMLEQLFYGLKGNSCVVQADDATAAFGEDDLLHIPLGSSHGVAVSAPSELHYIWIDLFRDRSGMSWITQEHQQE
jgi:hypothetical protein